MKGEIQTEIGIVISILIMFVEPKLSPQRLFSGWCPETVVYVYLGIFFTVLIW